jgi:hypothetical protein
MVAITDYEALGRMIFGISSLLYLRVPFNRTTGHHHTSTNETRQQRGKDGSTFMMKGQIIETTPASLSGA